MAVRLKRNTCSISNTEVKLLNVEGTSTSRTGRIENSQTKHKSLERVIFLCKNIVDNNYLIYNYK